jgi:hypothetical protein
MGELARLRELLEGVIGGGNGPRGPGASAPSPTESERQTDAATKETPRVQPEMADEETREVSRADATAPMKSVSDGPTAQGGPRQRRNGGNRQTARSA